MPRRGTVTALVFALLCALGCAEKPGAGGGADDRGAGETASGERRPSGPPIRTVLTWTRLLPQDAAAFGAQGIVLGPSPPSGLTAAPEVPKAGEGALHYGELRMGAEPQRGRGRDVLVAVLESPKPKDGDERRPWRLFVDHDLDGDLREERSVPAAPVARGRGEIEVAGAQFPVVEILGPLGGVHALLVNVLVTEARSGRSGGGRRSAVLQAQAACALAGRVRIFGAERDVVVYDADANGVFGDYTKSPDRAGDVIWIDFDADGRRTDPEMLFLAPRLLRHGRVAAVEVSPRTRELVVTELDVPLGAIRPAVGDPPESVSVQLFSEEYRLIAPGPAELVPAGSYTLERYAIRRGDIDGSQWLLAGGWLAGSGPRVRVRDGETTELPFGPPVEVRAWVRYDLGDPREKGVLIIVTLRGSASENVRLGFTVEGKEKLAEWGEFRILAGPRVLGTGRLNHMPAMPGAGGTIWKPPEEIERGRRLVLEVSPDLGPFKEGFNSRTEFDYGKPTPIRLVVSEIEPGTQAERVGLKPGDLIVSYDSKTVDGPMDLMRAIGAAAEKARVELVVSRGGSELKFALLPGKIGIMTALALP